MAEGYKDSQSQLSSATQHVTHAKANWRQARPPKAVDVKQEQPDPDLQNGAAFIAGSVSDLLIPVNRFTASITVTAFHQCHKSSMLCECTMLICAGLSCQEVAVTVKSLWLFIGLHSKPVQSSDVMPNVLFAGMGADLSTSLEDAVKPAAQRNKRSKTGQ